MGCLHFIRTRIWCNVSENVEGSSDLHKTHTGCKGKIVVLYKLCFYIVKRTGKTIVHLMVKA